MDTRDFNKFHDLIFTFVRVISKPRMDVTIMIPTKMNEMCWDQNFTWDEEKEQRDVKNFALKREFREETDTIFFNDNSFQSAFIYSLTSISSFKTQSHTWGEQL